MGIKSYNIYSEKIGNLSCTYIKSIIFLSNILIYLIKRRKVRIYNASVIRFNKSIIRFIIAGLNLDLSFNDLTLVRELNG